MKVIDLIKNNGSRTAFSFEVLPPLKGTGTEALFRTIDVLREFDPKYVNITTHRGEYVYKDLGEGLRDPLRRLQRGENIREGKGGAGRIRLFPG